jgi:hypothetical protein
MSLQGWRQKVLENPDFIVVRLDRAERETRSVRVQGG